MVPDRAPALSAGDRIVGGWVVSETLSTHGVHQRYQARDDRGRLGIVDVMVGVAERTRLLEAFVEDVEDWGDAGGAQLAQVVAAGRGRRKADAVRIVRQPPGSPLDHLSLPVDVGIAVRIACDVTRALASAHARGLVHGDVRASRVWVERGRARLEPGGVRDALTAAGVPLPAPSGIELAPELADGGFDRPADIYGVGVILCELITGRPPEVRSTGRRGAPSMTPMPVAIAQIIEATLQEDPQDRPTAPELVAMLTEEIGATSQEGLFDALSEPRTIEPRLIDAAHMEQRPTLPDAGRRSKVPATARESRPPELGTHETHIPDAALFAAGAVVALLGMLLLWVLL